MLHRFQMAVINSPPTSKKFTVDSGSVHSMPSLYPRLVFAYEMYQLDVTLVMSVCWLPLILSVWGTVVGVTETVPRFMFVVLIEQSLISSIKAISGSCQCM